MFRCISYYEAGFSGSFKKVITNITSLKHLIVNNCICKDNIYPCFPDYDKGYNGSNTCTLTFSTNLPNCSTILSCLKRCGKSDMYDYSSILQTNCVDTTTTINTPSLCEIDKIKSQDTSQYYTTVYNLQHTVEQLNSRIATSIGFKISYSKSESASFKPTDTITRSWNKIVQYKTVKIPLLHKTYISSNPTQVLTANSINFVKKDAPIQESKKSLKDFLIANYIILIASGTFIIGILQIIIKQVCCGSNKNSHSNKYEMDNT